MISKLSRAGKKLEKSGRMKCSFGECFGVMRVPLNRVSSNSAGPFSQSAIEDGIVFLLQTTQCVCEARKFTRLNSSNAKEISKFLKIFDFFSFIFLVSLIFF